MRLLLIFLFYITCILADSNTIELKKESWPFEGIFGIFDRVAIERGWKVYDQVCSSCHGINQLTYRNLEKVGFSKEYISNITSRYFIQDGPNEQGEFFQRKASLNDYFVNPFNNEEQAKYMNNGAYPPDLSLIIKARSRGPDYLYSLLTGYTDPPEDFVLPEGLYYNEYYPGHKIAMPPPLYQGQVVYNDDIYPTVAQMSRDLTIFLQWVAEPEMEHRKSLGIKVFSFLTFLTILFYFAKNNIWFKKD